MSSDSAHAASSPPPCSPDAKRGCSSRLANSRRDPGIPAESGAGQEPQPAERGCSSITTLSGMRIRLTVTGGSSKESGEKTRYAVLVSMVDAAESWVVDRHLQHFASLDKMLRKELETCGMLHKLQARIPRKKLFDGSLHRDAGKKRKQQLHSYLVSALQLADTCPKAKSLLCSFLEINEPAVIAASAGHLEKATQNIAEEKKQNHGIEATTNLPWNHATLKSPKNGTPKFEQSSPTSKFDSVLAAMVKQFRHGWPLKPKRNSTSSGVSTSRSQSQTGSGTKSGTQSRGSIETNPSAQLPAPSAQYTSAPEITDSTVAKGYLFKRDGVGRKSWKRRWVEIRDGSFYVYASPPPSNTLLGLVSLSSKADSIAECMSSEQARNFRVPPECFGMIVTTYTRQMLLYSQSEEERESWMNVIRIGMQLSNESEPTREGNLLQGNMDANGSIASSATSTVAHYAEQKPDPRSAKTTEVETLQATLTTSYLEASQPQLDINRAPSFPTSLSVDYGNKAANKYITEEENFDAPDLRRQDPWEVDWSEVEVKEVVGQGSFGQVSRGALWGSEVAVKKLLCDDLSPAALRSLRKEVTILSQLRHPACILYIGACTQPPNVCMITEWCSRGSLYDVLHSMATLDARRRLDLTLQIAKGMSYLHSRPKQIIHRDLKSMNVLITHAWQARVADFGLTIVRRRSEFADDDDPGGHFGIQGTPQWMAPEVMEGDRYNCKIDVYSFGIVLTEIFTRRMPFTDKYKGFDFVDAVLEGETPTVPVWACKNSVDPDAAEEDVVESESEKAPVFHRRSSKFILNAMGLEPRGFSLVFPAGSESREGEDVEDEPGCTRNSPMKRRSKSEHYKEVVSTGKGVMEQETQARQASTSRKIPGRPDDSTQLCGKDKARNTLPMTKSEHSLKNSNSYAEDIMSVRVENSCQLQGGKHPSNIQSIILACLRRDPRQRPGFQEIVVRLNELIENSHEDLLAHFDLPRLHEMLEVGTLMDLSLAAREITWLCRNVQLGQALGSIDVADDSREEEFPDFSSASSSPNKKRAIIASWASPIIVRIVDRLTREMGVIVTTRGEHVHVHTPQRILAELGMSSYLLIHTCGEDNGVILQAANMIVDQGALPILSQLLLFSDAAQDFERLPSRPPSVYDHEAELEQLLKNRNPNYSSLMHIGLLLATLALSCEGRVQLAIKQVLQDQLSSIDAGSPAYVRAKSRCESVGIWISSDDSEIRFDEPPQLPGFEEDHATQPRRPNRYPLVSSPSWRSSQTPISSIYRPERDQLIEHIEVLKEENAILLNEVDHLKNQVRQLSRFRS